MPLGDGHILRAAIGGALQGVAGSVGLPEAAIPAIAAAAANRVQSDPKMQNATNQEPLHQSGVMWGGGVTTLGAFAIVAQQLAAWEAGGWAAVDWGIAVPAVFVLGGGVFTIVRRVGSFKPLSLFGLLKKGA